jgi:transglutaminase-like putative cysteine protease
VVFAAAASLCLAALVWMYFDTFTLRPRRVVNNAKDPRFHVVDFHSRQATEGEIYDVAEIPVISRVREAGPRRLRFSFRQPIKAAAWEIRDAADGRIVSEGPHPEVSFPDQAGDLSVVLVPRGVKLLREIRLTINFYPKEAYAASGLSWPDNYWLKSSSVPVSRKTPHRIDDWVGLRPDDPDLEEARRLLPPDVASPAATFDRAERVFLFVAEALKDAGGTPSDAVQAASPLETYKLLSSGRGRGFCENKALVYYLFANAAGVKTRLVDMAGKIGPLKLTGHYFCESWLPEEGRWIFVDPQSGISSVRDPEGRLLHALGVKKAFDAGAFSRCEARVFDPVWKAMTTKGGGVFAGSLGDYFSGRPILAFKPGYGRNRGYSKLRHFVSRPTLLYADFPLPRLYLLKLLAAAGLAASLLALIILGAVGCRRRPPSRHGAPT